MRRPLLFMRKRSLLGSFLGKHANSVSTLSKSVGDFIDPTHILAPLEFYALLKSSVIPDVGVFAAFARASAALFSDQEGLEKEAISGEARFTGARHVYNRLPDPDVRNFTNTGTGVITEDGTHELPDGTVVTVYNVVVPADGSIQLKDEITNVAGTEIRNSLYYKHVSGTLYSDELRLYRGLKPAVDVNIISASVGDGEWARLSADSEVATGVLANCGINGTALTEFTFQICAVMQQAVTDQTNKNPDDYVSVGLLSAPYHGLGADGAKAFVTTNANTVTDSIVTEADGILLGTIKGFLSEEKRTNYFLNSSAPVTQVIDFTAAGAGSYTLSLRGAGTCTCAAVTAAGINFGVSSDGTKITFTLFVAGTVSFTMAGADGTTDVQVENGNHVSSYIETGGAAVIREKDELTYDAPSKFEDNADISYVLAGEIYLPLDGTEYITGGIMASIEGAINLVKFGVEPTSGEAVVTTVHNGSEISMNSAAALTAGTHTICIRYDKDTQLLDMWVDHIKEASPVSQVEPLTLGAGTLYIGASSTLNSQCGKEINKISIYGDSLSDARCASLPVEVGY